MHLLSSHPSRTDLLDFAEQLERDFGRTSSAIHTHIAECDRCLGEVERARATIAITRHAAELEPSREWRAQMLLNARQVRGRGGSSSPYRLMRSNRRAMAATTALILISSLSIAVLLSTDADSDGRGDAIGPSRASVFSLDVLRQATLEERLLAPAVLRDPGPVTPWEASQHRAVHAWDAEIDEALEALESNPACVRAATLVNNNRERLGETLKVLYVESNF